MKYHLVGILGSGMSALAQVLKFEGADVSGSDRRLSGGTMPEIARIMQAAGIELVPQDGTGIRGASVVVCSTAIEADNPDLLEAGRMDIPVEHRAECLSRLLNGRNLVGVTGTSGKTTVTAMVGWVLEQTGREPWVINGGIVKSWSGAKRVGNVRKGSGGTWVAEIDESDRSLLWFRPQYAVITNSSRDHFDINETNNLFDKFKSRVKGPVVDGRWIHEEPFDDLVLTADSSEFTYRNRRFKLPCPGVHNVWNACLAVNLCFMLEVELSDSAEALSRFPGVHRRMEVVGKCRGIVVIDDFAHNPAKIEAAWNAVAPYCRRVLAVWRPHGFGPLRSMRDDLAELFRRLCRQDDRLYLLPVYYAGGTAGAKENSDVLAGLLHDCGVNVVTVESLEAAAGIIASTAESGDVALIMGARDPDLPALAGKVMDNLFRRI